MPKRRPPPTDAEIAEAEALVWEAMEQLGEPGCFELLERAAALDPECTDARLMLIEFDHPPLADRVPLLAQVVRDAARRLGPASFAEHVGHFWLRHETRPYMRARMTYAIALAESGREPQAIDEYLGLLHLCPGDNLGVRYGLFGLLLALDRRDDADRLVAAYADELSATMAWGRVLLAFLHGEIEQAALALRLARSTNPHVEPYLAARVKLPTELPESWSSGTPEEALMTARDLGEAWRRHPEAVLWLRAQPVGRRGGAAGGRARR